MDLPQAPRDIKYAFLQAPSHPKIWLVGSEGFSTTGVVDTVDTVMNIAVIAHDGLWEHTPLTLFSLVTLLKRLTLLDFAQYMNARFYFDCLGHHELENIAHAHDGQGGFEFL